jgi:probable addiction module antidote protein
MRVEKPPLSPPLGGVEGASSNLLSGWIAFVVFAIFQNQDRLAPHEKSPGLIAMPVTRTTRYDVAEHLRTTEEMAAYLEACLEEANGDAAFIAKALGDIARARGMTQVAPGCRALSRKSLQGALRGTQPGLRYHPQSRRSFGNQAACGSRVNAAGPPWNT